MRTNTDHIVWGPPPAEPHGPFIPIYSGSACGPIKLLILGDLVEGVWTHWIGRTTPCIKGGDRKCVCENTTVPARWKGYLACYDMTSCRRCIAELTSDSLRAAHKNPQLAPVQARGKVLRLWRMKGRANAPVRFEVTTESIDLDELPETFDVRAALRRVWGV